MLFRNSKLYWYLKRKRRKANVRKGAYSQFGQDVITFELLGNPVTGTFLDIGANDGVTGSNSLLFERIGWNGICIEPNPTIFKILETKRNCPKVNACISATDGTADFLVVDGPCNMLSGIKDFLEDSHLRRINREIKEAGGRTRIIEIETLSPKTLLERFNINEVDYLSIDTEGAELSILKNFNFKEISVKVIGVENNIRSPDIFYYLTSKGYQLVKCVGCDEIYMRR